MKKRGQIKAVFFDLDDTLVSTCNANKAAHAAVQQLISSRAPTVDDEAIVKAFVDGFTLKPWDPEHKVDVTEWRACIWHTALQLQGVEDMSLARDLQACFDRERLLAFRWTEGVEMLVEKLNKKGVKVGIITNGHTTVQRTKLKACRAEELFEIILVGGEEQLEKPHREIFLKASRLAGCEAEECIMVGDNLKTDIQGGFNARFLATIWVNMNNVSSIPKDVAIPDYAISHISELQCILESIDESFVN